MLALVLASAGCSRFDRNNPNDPGADTGLQLRRSEEALVVSDSADVDDGNNGNGLIEPGEEVVVSIPLEVRRSPGSLTANATLTDESDGDCVATVSTEGAAVEVALPATSGAGWAPLTAGPFTLVLEDEGCDFQEPLTFKLELQFIQVELTLSVEVLVDVAEPDDSQPPDDQDASQDASQDDEDAGA